MKVLWTDEYTLHLIANVQAAEYMWNSKCVSYKNKLKKQRFWSSLVNEFNSRFKPIVPFEYGEVMRKWNNLKSYFVAEKQRIFKAQKSGASADAIEAISGTWKYYIAMNFLSSTISSTPSVNHFTKEGNLNFLQGSSSNEMEAASLDSTPAAKHTSVLDERPFKLSSPTTISNEFEQSQYPLQSPDIAPPRSSSPAMPFPYKLSPPSIPAAMPSPHTSPRLLTSPSSSSRSQFNRSNHKHPTKKRKTGGKKQALAAILIKKSNELSEALTKRLNCATDNSNDKMSFGKWIAFELSKLDEDLQLQSQREIFDIIWSSKVEQLKRKSN